MADETTREPRSLDSFIESLSAVAQEHFADGEVDTPVLHFLNDQSIGVLPLWPLPGLDAAHMARLVVGLYDPPVAAVLAEGWATNLALPRAVDEALARKRPWDEVSDQVRKRVAPALADNPGLAEALRRGDVDALDSVHRQALTYAWHEKTMGPVVRGKKSLRDLPPEMRRKVLTLFGEDRQGNCRTLLWRIESRGGRRHFVREPMEASNETASRWRPLYIAQEMAAQMHMPTALVRVRVREYCREQLRPYKLVENIAFGGTDDFFGTSTPPYAQ